MKSRIIIFIKESDDKLEELANKIFETFEKQYSLSIEVEDGTTN